MTLRILLAFLALMLTTNAHATRPLNPLLPKFEALIHKSMKEKKVPGLAVAIVKDGKIIFMKGFGVRAVGHPERVTTQTVFQIGSASKAITSVLVALLRREKIMSLDHPVSMLPQVTVKHLLSHTTGIPKHTTDEPSLHFNTLIEKGVPAVDVYKKVSETMADASPGEKFAYHNVVYGLLGEIIEEQVGASFEDVLQRYLLQLLNMKNTSSTWAGFDAQANKAAVHMISDGAKKKGKKSQAVTKCAMKVPFRQDYANFPAAAGVSSNIHDMALFLAAILGARPDVITTKDLEAFIQPLIHTPDQWQRSSIHRDRITATHYGLGWRTMTFGGYHMVFHGGWIRGISSLISFIPEEKIGIVILQNAEMGLPFGLSMQFYDWALGLPPKKWIK